MSDANRNFLARTFESFSRFGYLPLLEASTLSKTGMPKQMISAIHQKAEHFSEDYPRMAHTYRSKVAIPMPYKHYTPAHDIEITEPTVAVGRRTNVDPYSGRTINSFYTDFHWFLENLPYGPNRVLIANPDLEFYMYIYDKSKSKGATGMQYAILFWDKEKKKAIDFGYSELTTRAVDLSQIRGVHDTKGGNRSDKIQEFIRSTTREGDKAYAPSPSKPLYLYKLAIDVSGQTEPRGTRAARAKAREVSVTSLDAVEVFAKKYASLFLKLKPEVMETLRKSIMLMQETNASAPSAIQNMASELEVPASKLYLYLVLKMKDFRKEIFEEGRSRLPEGKSYYQRTTGFDLSDENRNIRSVFKKGGTYTFGSKVYSPDEETNAPETQYREAQPEKYKRSLPTPGDYASIQSIIKTHSLDGFLSRFAWFILTDRIKFPETSVASLLGITVADTDTSVDSEGDSWLY